MTQQRLRRQVEAILEANGMKWTEDDGRLAMRFDSALVHVALYEWGSQQLITIGSNVLQEIPSLPGGNLPILSAVNDLNLATSFGKWVYQDDCRTIFLEYELLGDNLQEPELMTALAAIARLADRHDDMLQAKLGGHKSFE